MTWQYLERRKRQQEAAAKERQAFYDFQFTNRVNPSGIRLEHQIVDDAGKSYKAAHYDHGNGLAVTDVDGDGWLDIYFTTQLGRNQLWRNLGGGKFEEITDQAGVALTDQISVAAAFADIDNDGAPDLFVTTVRHGNHLFRNLGHGRFTDITREAGLDYVGHSSGAVFFDFDNDGLLDLLLTNVGIYTTNQKGRGGYYLAMPDAFYGHLYPERTEFSILYQNALQEGRKSAYFTLEQSKDILLEHMSELGFTDEKAFKHMMILDMGTVRKNLNFLQARGTWIELFKMYASNFMKAEKISLLALDSMEVMETMAKFQDRRTDLYYLFEWLRDLGTTSLVVSENPADAPVTGHFPEEAYLADGIIQLGLHPTSDLYVQRRVRCVKMRSTKHETGYYALAFDEGKFEVTRAVSGG